MTDVVSISSLIFGILSFGFAVYQWRENNSLKKYRIKTLRSDLRTCNAIATNAYYSILALEASEVENAKYIHRVYGIHSKARVLVRSILQELSEIDTPYDEKRLAHYVRSGLITSKWLWCQALGFVSEAKPDIEVPELPDETPDWMENFLEHEIN